MLVYIANPRRRFLHCSAAEIENDLWLGSDQATEMKKLIGPEGVVLGNAPRVVEHADALVADDVAARWVLDAQAGAPSGAVAKELESGADFHFAVHNAAGMVSVQEGISVAEALIRLRAFAFGNDRLLADVANEVVARRLRMG